MRDQVVPATWLKDLILTLPGYEDADRSAWWHMEVVSASGALVSCCTKPTADGMITVSQVALDLHRVKSPSGEPYDIFLGRCAACQSVNWFGPPGLHE